ncbi:cold shock domain-containing protein [Photobacterium carnosum]|nr:cold shock domain-containing protein [Photobacterium carnosum]MCD9512326.1 hypothetical protein [Photobacterium phosphoreum]MCD9534434.1 hypothetical protein [Photobacterium carnosum]
MNHIYIRDITCLINNTLNKVKGFGFKTKDNDSIDVFTHFLAISVF